jgi:hypothetical protein
VRTIIASTPRNRICDLALLSSNDTKYVSHSGKFTAPFFENVSAPINPTKKTPIKSNIPIRDCKQITKDKFNFSRRGIIDSINFILGFSFSSTYE